MTGETYPATPYLRHMAADKQWQGQLVRDRHGQPYALVAVRVGPTWTDAVAIEAEDPRRTRRARPSTTSNAVWRSASSRPYGYQIAVEPRAGHAA